MASTDETIILINEADRQAGFFNFSTTKAVEFNRLCKRIGGEDKLMSVKTYTQGSEVVSWVCRVPIEFLRPGWKISPKHKGGGKGNPQNFKKKVEDE